MRLRTTLALSFLVLSLLQVALVVPITLRNLRSLLSRQEAQRLDRAMLAVEATAQRHRDDARRAMDELAQSAALEDVTRDAARVPPPATLTSAGAGLMKPRGLQVLSLLDGEGRTLSSGHLPARLGDVDEVLFAVAKEPSGTLRTAMIDLPDENGLRRAPALVTARAVDYGDARLWAVGGLLLDDAFAGELARLTGAQVDILADGAVVASTGSTAASATVRSVDFPPAAQVRLSFSRADLLATQSQVLQALLAFASLGLLLTLVVGLLLSRRITRPLDALTDASRRIAAGELEVKVVERAAGEVKTLIDTFNRMTADLKVTTERLVASERVAAWQEVARRLAHEIKNPLTPIKMSLETLMAAGQRNDPRFGQLFKESAGAVLEEVDRLRRTVDEFSHFARLPKAALAPLALSEVLGQLLALYAPHGTPEIRYRQELAPGVRVQGDRDQLTQVVVNLIKNAEEAMAERGGTVTVRVRTEGEQALVEVEDEGPGIAPEALSRIFEPYVTTKQGGTGLGLAIAARISQDHGGQLTATSPAGHGACFTLRLPRMSDR